MMNLQEYTDEELVTSAQAGDAEAESVLMNRYKQLVKSKAASYYMAGPYRESLHTKADYKCGQRLFKEKAYSFKRVFISESSCI